MSVRSLLAILSVTLCFASPTVGQQVADLPASDLAYRSARSQHETALLAWTQVEQQWNAALEDHARARRLGDQDLQDLALTRALDLARELDRLERRVREQTTELATARAALLLAIDARISGLELQLGAARSAAEGTRILALLRDLENQQAELVGEAEGSTFRAEPVFYPSIQYDPRDDASTLAAKAQLLRSKADQADSLMAQIDRETRRIEGQLRRARNVQSLVAGVERFGDIQAPGAPGRSPGPAAVPARADSTGVVGPAPTPEQQLQELRTLRDQVETAKSEFLRRAGTFETLLRRVG